RYIQSPSLDFTIGGVLASVEDVAESNFLVEHADLYLSKTSGFWIGIYRNVNGQLLWQDKSALGFVNWGEGQPLEDQLDCCVELSAFSGYWSILPCSSQKGFICKKPKIHPFLFALCLFTDSKKNKAHSRMNMWILVTLILLILLGMGFMIYFLFKIKTQSASEREARWHSTLVECNRVLTGKDDENDSTNKNNKKMNIAS
ncbi:MRC1 protein, partial [Nycticryphes semicollaris]|nr:MRC1 protein [Nycticryphes semicollaris]